MVVLVTIDMLSIFDFQMWQEFWNEAGIELSFGFCKSWERLRFYGRQMDKEFRKYMFSYLI